MAYDNFRRQIEVLEHNGIDDINLPTQYASLAQCALELDKCPIRRSSRCRRPRRCPQADHLSGIYRQ